MISILANYGQAARTYTASMGADLGPSSHARPLKSPAFLPTRGFPLEPGEDPLRAVAVAQGSCGS
jgi:hypothetical protein